MKRHLHLLSSPAFFMATLFILTSLLGTACSTAPQAQKSHTVGIVNYSKTLNVTVENFESEMTELGYVEGKDITYIYNDALTSDPQEVEAEVKRIMDQKVELFLTMGAPSTRAVVKAAEGTSIPVIFAPVINPVGEGIVASISHPGGNATGVQSINVAPKALEWLLQVVPATKKVYVFYHPEDNPSIVIVKSLPEAASGLGVELVLTKVQSGEEVLAAVPTLPKDASIFLIPGTRLESSTEAILKLATEHDVPVGGYNRPEEDLLLNYTTDRAVQGKQAARLADQVFKGVKPADLPVESPEFLLIINLKVANAIGLNIPDSTLHQANKVIR